MQAELRPCTGSTGLQTALPDPEEVCSLARAVALLGFPFSPGAAAHRRPILVATGMLPAFHPALS
eukprot:1001674-Pelagomonas_calceolata.AAC.6